MKWLPMTIPMYNNFFYLTNFILLEKYILKTHCIHIIAQNSNIRPEVTAAYVDIKKIYNILPKMPVYENQPISGIELNNHVCNFESIGKMYKIFT